MNVIEAVAISSVVTGVITGILSSFGTIAALKVHITYLRETLSRHDTRLTDVERNQRALRDDAPINHC